MAYIVSSYKRIINFGIRDEWDLDKKRSYRQVNEFNLFLCVIAFSAIPLALSLHIYLGALLQLTGFGLYALGFYLVSKEKLAGARLLAIHTFEVHLFLVTFFAVFPTNMNFMPWYSPVFVVFMVYPLVAALFDRPVFGNMFIAILQIFLIQVIASLMFDPFNYSPLVRSMNLLNIIVCIYTIIIASIIVYLLYSENHAVKVLEIERSKMLEEALEEIRTSRDMIQNQANDLKRLNNSKDKFFSIIAHDLKSPFNVVLGFSQILKDKDRHDPETRMYAKQIYDAALNNYNLLENLLEWSRSQLNHIKFEPEVFLIDEAIQQTLTLVTISAEKKGITINNKADNRLKIHADRNLVNTIIRNVVTNAIKYTKPGGTVTIMSEVYKGHAKVAVADDGIGMNETTLKDLFSIEKKYSRRGTSSEKGTGLGLILCKDFVEMHGGTIWVESKENGGSTFHFTLPLSEESVKTEWTKNESQSRLN